MIIIGERLNSARKEVHQALLNKDEEFFSKNAKLQREKGADFIDLNTASMLEDELESMKWAIEIIQREEAIPVSIDSPNVEVLAEALKIHKGRALLNSITVSEEKVKKIAPIIQEKDPLVVVMLMDTSTPSTPEECLEKLEKFFEIMEKYKLKINNFLFDPLLRPIGVESKNALLFLNSLKLIKNKYPEIKTICGLSNVSYGLPARRLINRTLFPLILYNGIDAIILDVLDEKLVSTIIVSNALLGKEDGIIKLLKAKREGKLID